MALSEREQAVVDAIANRREEIVALVTALVAFDTTARSSEDPPRQEAALQALLAERLAAAGAEVEVFEPNAAEMQGQPLVPPGLGFEGRPQMIARFRGTVGVEKTTIVIDALRTLREEWRKQRSFRHP